MTFRQHCMEHLIGLGMPWINAEEVVKLSIDCNFAKSFRGRWDMEVGDFPDSFLVGVMLILRVNAALYVEANCPTASFAANFPRRTRKPHDHRRQRRA